MRDKKFFLLALALQNATQDMLNNLVDEIDDIFKKHSRGSEIVDQRLLERAVNEVIDRFYSLFVEQLLETGEAVGQAKADAELKKVLPLLVNAGLYRDAISFYNEVKAYNATAKERLLFTKRFGLTLDVRIKTLQSGTQRTVRNLIVNAMADGKGATEIAKLVEQYVNPTPNATKVSPLEEYRKRYGRPKSFTPRGVPQGSVQYNALRIARTETAFVYREATLDFYEDKAWNKGFRWVLSNRHPEYDICDEYAKEIYQDREDVPYTHPNCLCDIQSVPMNSREIKELVAGREADDDLMRRAIGVSRDILNV